MCPPQPLHLREACQFPTTLTGALHQVLLTSVVPGDPWSKSGEIYGRSLGLSPEDESTGVWGEEEMPIVSGGEAVLGRPFLGP